MNKLNYHLYKIYAIITLVILQFILTASAFSQNKALRMDDLDDYIDLSPWAEQLIFNSPMTLEFWFRPNFDHKCTSGEPCYSSILAISNGVQPSSIGKFLFIGYGNSLGTFVNEQISIGRRNGSSFNTSIVGSTDAGTLTNEWHHYSIVINGTSWLVYRDGKETGSYQFFSGGGDEKGRYGENILPKMYAIIGADNTSLTYSGFLNGVIDELRIWNTVRSIDDIRYNYTKNIDLPQTGLIAYYKFDQLEDLSQGNTGVNDIRDYSGNGLHGDAVGGPIIDDNAAPLQESSNALHFDGVNDIVELTSNPNLTPKTNAISVESWIYCDELRHAPIAGKYNSINLANDPFTGISWLLQVTDDGKLEFDVCGNKNATIYRYKVSNNPVITAGQWTHVAATFSTVTQDIKLYVNGIEVAGTYPPGGQATITNIFDSFTPLRLGKIIGGSSQPHFKGTMDEFRLWNYVRSQEQILSSKNCQLDGNENGLVLYYTFDQGRASGQNAGGNILQDKSSNLFNGQLIGHSLTGSSSNFVTGYNQVSSPCEADSIGPNDLLVTTEYHLTGTDTFNNVYVEPGATLICDGTLYVTENILIKQFGEITHTSRFVEGANIIVDGKLTIEESGVINVTGKGLLGGYNGSVFSPDGEAYDLNGQIVSGADRGDNVNSPGWGGAGGSYGGFGANVRELGQFSAIISNELYGLLEKPDFLGSGGGGSPCGGCNQAGGNGGGKIKITANLIDLFGKISANGANSTGGGGSGGSIILEVGKITGHGTIEAKGGSADWNFYKPGSGGGGRISIKYDSLEISTNQILASGGVGPFNGCTGTIYFKDSQKSLGDIVINGSNIPSPKETPLLSNLIHFNKIELINQARVIISANSNITIDTLRIYASKVRAINTLEFTSSQYIDLDQSGELYIDALGEITFPQFNETYSRFVSGKIYILEGSKLNILNKSITIPPGITLIKDGTFGSNDIIDDLTIRNLGILTHSNRHLNGLNLTISNNLTIDAGGSINVTEKGLYGGLNGSIYGAYGEVFDTVGNITGISCSPIAGASYGGWGGRESTQISTNHPYGLIEDPSYLGSGGSAFCDGYGARGGNGGGRVMINAQNIIVNGSIQANGGNGVQGNMRYSGGGSGGSIKIISENISGSGIIQANGGRGSCQYCSAADYMSGGGGGRIAVFYTTNAIPLSNFQASGASFGADIGNEKNGGAGTIFLKENNQSKGSLIISNANIQQLSWTPYLTNESTLNTLRIEGKSKLVTSKHITLSSATDLFIQNGDFHIDEAINFTIPAINQINLIKGSLHISEHAIVKLTNKDIIIPSGFSLIKDGKFGESDEINSLIIQSGGNITHSTRFQNGLFLKSKGIIEIQSGASIDCYGKGLLGGYGKSSSQWISDDSSKGETYDQNGQIIRFGHVNSNVGFGGSYGGSGGSGSNFDTLLQPIYGDKNFPAFLGSGGSATLSTSNNLDAGNGGGRVIIQASELRVNGMINVDGANAASLGGGGGSGGTVLIFTPNINGSGTITANGGFGRCFPNCASWGGDGGGGRIAIYTQNPLFPENKVVASQGVNGSFDAEPGTIVYVSCNYEKNAGLQEILSPLTGTIVPLDTIILPKVVVKNLSPNSLIFPVSVLIGADYTDESLINLPSGSSDTIEFTPYTVNFPGTIQAIFRISSNEDNCDETDELMANLTVQSGEGPVITDNTPKRGGNTGSVTLKITGNHFRPGILVMLINGAGLELTAHYVDFRNPKLLYASFDLQGSPIGVYDLKVLNPDGNSSVFQFAFEVEKGTIGWSGLAQEDCLAGEFDAGQLLEVRIDSPRRATFGRTFPVRIRYKNIGNIDIPLSNKIFKTKNNDLVNFDRCLISRCICTSYQDPSTLKWYSTCRTECGSSCSTVVNTKFVTVRLDEQNGPKNLLRAGATGEKTIFVRPTHSGYSNSGESIMKFILE